MLTLTQLHTDIDTRIHTIRNKHPEWLCGKGCDNCCRRLAEIPQLTVMEWSLLREGLMLLPAERLQEISLNVAALRSQQSRLVTCPMLDQQTNACPVYAQRPVACRTYGFYVQRDLGLYCHDIEMQVAEGNLADVVWGNQDAIDRRLTHLGETHKLTEWFELWEK